MELVKKNFAFIEDSRYEFDNFDVYAYVVKRTANYVTLEFGGKYAYCALRDHNGANPSRFKIHTRDYGIATVEYVVFKHFYSNGASKELIAGIERIKKAKNLLEEIQEYQATIDAAQEKINAVEKELKSLWK